MTTIPDTARESPMPPPGDPMFDAALQAARLCRIAERIEILAGAAATNPASQAQLIQEVRECGLIARLLLREICGRVE